MTGTFSISVVAKMNFTWSGGSSSDLQQAVERLFRQHVHFVDDIDLGARQDWPVAGVVDDLAYVVDAGMRGGVHLDHVDMARIDDRLAMHAEFRHMDGRLHHRRPVGARRQLHN